jgi:hypothetical protein
MSERCPNCKGSLETVRQSNGMLNSDQFDSVKCGDYYCDKCRQYWWTRLVPSDRQSGHSTRPVTTHEAISPDVKS